MSSPQGGSGSVHHDGPRDGGNAAESPTCETSSTTQSTVHADSETSLTDATESHHLEQETSDSVGSSGPSTGGEGGGEESRVIPEMAPPGLASPQDHHTSTETETDVGVPSDRNNNTELSTSHPTTPTPASPVAHVPRVVSQSEATRVQVQDISNPPAHWPSAQERYRAAYSRARSENDRQSEMFGPGLQLYAPNNNYIQSAVDEGQGEASRRGSQDVRGVRPRDEVTAMPEFALPRWQPDAEVTYCPICRTQFSFFVRKHHCRYVRYHSFSTATRIEEFSRLTNTTCVKEMWSSGVRYLFSS